MESTVIESTESFIIVGLVLPIYILGIILPGVTLNGLIVVTFLRVKKLHTPSNLLAVHISVVGLLISLFYSTISIPAFALSVIECSCELTYYKWILAHIFHFALYPLNIAAITISYFLIIKYSAQILTFFRVTTVIVIMWLAAIIGNAPTVFLVPLDDFVTCCEELCKNDTYICDDLTGAFTPNLFSVSSEIFFIFLDIFFIYFPCIAVVVFSAISFYIFKYSVVHPKSSLRRRMFLLPILMTVADVVLLVGQNIINWAPITTHSDNIPGDIIPFVFGLTWDISCVVYPIIILYFNVKLRKACRNMITCRNEDNFNLTSTTVIKDQEKSIGTINNENLNGTTIIKDEQMPPNEINLVNQTHDNFTVQVQETKNELSSSTSSE